MIQLLADGNIDMDALEIGDIVDLALLQKFQDNFAIGMNCASVTVDRDGNPVTKPSSYTQFCDRFVHHSQIGDERCALSHQKMGQQAASIGRPYIGACHAGLIDFAAPIIVDHKLIGTVLGGQMLSDKPKQEVYQKVAKEIDVSETGLVEAVHKIKISDEKNIRAAAEVLFIVVNTLAENGYARLKLETITKRLTNKFLEISAAIQQLEASAQSVTEQQQKLNQEISQIGKITEDINSILKSISQVATNTKILGFNSSIEAARVGAAGKGFAVIATEIQKLSESSKETANQIFDLTNQIQRSVSSTVNHSQVTLHTTEEQTRAMEEVASSAQEIVYLADQLNSMMKSI